MNILTKTLLGSMVVATTLVGMTGTASARYRNRYDTDVGSVQLGAQFNYGIWTGDGDVNPFGPAVAARLGVTFLPGLYLGADFDYFFGETRSVSVGPAGGSVRFNVYDVLGEIGYDFWAHRAGVLRPKIGLGVGFLHGAGCAGVSGLGSTCSGDTRSGFTIAPGVQYMHFFDNIFLNVELRYEEILLDSLPNPSAVVLGIGLGAAF